MEQAIASLVVDFFRAFIKPALVIFAFTGVAVMNPELTRSLDPTPQAQSAANRAVLHTPHAPQPAPAPKPSRKGDAAAAKLARFHADAQTFNDKQDSINALADALNIPAHIVETDISRAIQLARDNSEAMKGYVGRFPLPAHTDTRLLVALMPSDIPHLERLIIHAAGIKKQRFTMHAELPSGDLHLETNVHALKQTGPRQCFRHAMTFMRRTFRHTLTATACRQGSRWFFSAADKTRSAK